MLCVDGSLLEVVRFKQSNDEANEPTQEEVDRWVDSFPLRVLSR